MIKVLTLVSLPILASQNVPPEHETLKTSIAEFQQKLEGFRKAGSLDIENRESLQKEISELYESLMRYMSYLEKDRLKECSFLSLIDGAIMSGYTGIRMPAPRDITFDMLLDHANRLSTNLQAIYDCF